MDKSIEPAMKVRPGLDVPTDTSYVFVQGARFMNQIYQSSARLPHNSEASSCLVLLTRPNSNSTVTANPESQQTNKEPSVQKSFSNHRPILTPILNLALTLTISPVESKWKPNRSSIYLHREKKRYCSSLILSNNPGTAKELHSITITHKLNHLNLNEYAYCLAASNPKLRTSPI